MAGSAKSWARRITATLCTAAEYRPFWNPDRGESGDVFVQPCRAVAIGVELLQPRPHVPRALGQRLVLGGALRVAVRVTVILGQRLDVVVPDAAVSVHVQF